MNNGPLIVSAILSILAIATTLFYFAAVSKTTGLNIRAISVGAYFTLISGICLPISGTYKE